MERTISRRSLLKTGAALGALAAAGSLGGTSWLTENQALAEEATTGETEVKHSWCYMCGPAKVFCSTLCYVKDGRITRDGQVRVLRDNIVIHEGKLGSLQRFKDSVKEVAANYECGMSIEKFNDIKEGDIFE